MIPDAWRAFLFFMCAINHDLPRVWISDDVAFGLDESWWLADEDRSYLGRRTHDESSVELLAAERHPVPPLDEHVRRAEENHRRHPDHLRLCLQR